MTYRATTSPLITVYEDSGQTISSSGTNKLQFDTFLHNNGSISNNTYTISFNSFVTADMKSDGATGYGGRLLIDIDGTTQTGKGSVVSGDVNATNAGVSNEIVASNVTADETIELYLQRGASSSITLNAFTRIIGVITI